jgi:hypothetical protein
MSIIGMAKDSRYKMLNGSRGRLPHPPPVVAGQAEAGEYYAATAAGWQFRKIDKCRANSSGYWNRKP